MKPSRLMLACIAVASLPVAALATDQQSDSAASSSAQRKHFDKLDNDRDGRLSKLEAASDSKLTFSSVDTNGDGYIDRMEYMRHQASGNSDRKAVPSSQSPESSSPNSPGASSKTDPNQAQGTQPASDRPQGEPPKH